MFWKSDRGLSVQSPPGQMCVGLCVYGLGPVYRAVSVPVYMCWGEDLFSTFCARTMGWRGNAHVYTSVTHAHYSSCWEEPTTTSKAGKIWGLT